jgi:hypothetical protein
MIVLIVYSSDFKCSDMLFYSLSKSFGPNSFSKEKNNNSENNSNPRGISIFFLGCSSYLSTMI